MARGFEVAKGFEDKEINLPIRKTKFSAGYDIEAAEDTVIPSFKKGDAPTLIPTGIKAYMEDDEVLYLYNRSSNPKKKGLILANSVGVVDKDFYTNSYHIDVREHIDAFSKLEFETELQKLSTGGAISYIEVGNMQKNLKALEELVKYIYENVQYAEFNTKSDYCHVCGFDGEIIINDDNEWECPNCGNKDKNRMNVTRRTCGYLGEHWWNEGKTKEIKERFVHLDNMCDCC